MYRVERRKPHAVQLLRALPCRRRDAHLLDRQAGPATDHVTHLDIRISAILKLQRRGPHQGMPAGDNTSKQIENRRCLSVDAWL